MKKYTKKQALSLVVKCAKTYAAELNERNLLFIISDKASKFLKLEVAFHSYNFLHLTGLKPCGIKAKDFFQRCLNGKLSVRDFEFSADGTTQMKLDILPNMINRNLSAKMAGDYNGSNINLYTQKITGNTSGCIGFVKSDMTNEYVPNTLLNIDIRKYTNQPLRIIAVCRKNIADSNYNELVYKAKKNTISEDELLDMANS